MTLLVFGLSPAPLTAQTRLPVVPLASPDVRPLVPQTLGIIVNLDDPQSLLLGEAYALRRGIPPQNILRVTVPLRNGITPAEFAPAEAQIRSAQTRLGLKGFAIAWQRPYRVNEQSLTSAISQGVSGVRKVAVCEPTDRNPLFKTPPGAGLVNPIAMMLIGGINYSESRDLVARAGKGDGRQWPGTVYHVVTGDKARSSPREAAFAQTKREFGDLIDIEVVKDGDSIVADAILGYQTGAIRLQSLQGLRFLNGSFADNLTSFSGRLYDSRGQSPITDFMRAGASASYGAVSEPCNYPEKFPDPVVLLGAYLRGDSLAEAYWKSVAETTEGLFIGEPLARPFYPATALLEDDTLRLSPTRFSQPGRYDLYRVETGTPLLVARGVTLPPYGDSDADRPAAILRAKLVDADAILALAPALPDTPPTKTGALER